MPVTTLHIGDNRMMFITQEFEDKSIAIDIYLCDKDYIPVGQPTGKMSGTNFTEAEYHINLRKDAHSKGQFVPGHSTNPEWNPVDTSSSEE